MNEKEIEITKINLERRKKGISEERDFALTHKNGKKVYIRIRASPIFDIEGNYEGTFAFLNNITQRKLTEQNLIESEEEFRKQNLFLNNILESLTHPFYVINVKDYTITLTNSAASSEGLEHGQYCYSLTHNINKPCEVPCKCPLEEVKKTKRACIVEHTHYDKEGNEKIYEIYGYPILDESGNVVQMIEYALNITDRKKAEQELIKLNNLKSELLRRTSHELKTPLVSIKGFSDLLLELHRDILDDYVIRTIEQIRMGCNRLESIVNDILKTAELESGTVELKKSKEDLSLLIKICISELEGLLALRNHTINLEISDNLICSFEKKQIFNVITNILSNAIKYTPYNGKIEVKSEINNGFIIISIKDNGLGFTEEEKTVIFKQFGKIERFGQGYDVISEGSGLGLFISKKIIELHSGEIWLESEGRDKGSTFYFSLPIDKK